MNILQIIGTIFMLGGIVVVAYKNTVKSRRP